MHPKVDNCAVVPMSDETTFQIPVAYIILKKRVSFIAGYQNGICLLCRKTSG